MNLTRQLALIALVGLGATAVMDLWALLLQRLGVPGTRFAMIGRWVGHLARGRLAHASIAKAAPIAGEQALGWLTHYAVGVAFAALFIGLQGTAWLQQPGFVTALGFGLVTVAAPWFVMQPALGAGVANARTPTPALNCLRNLANHAAFGAGLYLTARLAQSLA